KSVKTVFNFHRKYAIVFLAYLYDEREIFLQRGTGENLEKMQRNELNYFQVDGSCGRNQDWFPESSMRDGGCGAVAACESCIYFASEAGKTDLYPYGTKEIDKDEYIRFAYEMKPYLCPRPNGIDTLEMFMEGFEGYLHDV